MGYLFTTLLFKVTIYVVPFTFHML